MIKLQDQSQGSTVVVYLIWRKKAVSGEEYRTDALSAMISAYRDEPYDKTRLEAKLQEMSKAASDLGWESLKPQVEEISKLLALF